MAMDTDETRYTFTVFTPTFNRAYTLPRVFESLDRQTFRDFEWLVVDDGSTDDTRSLVEGWRHEKRFPIRYLHQPNSGKHVADNLAARLAHGRFIATLDSDDWYIPSTLERFLAIWESIPIGDREQYAGGVALCADRHNVLIGNPFPRDVFDTNYSDLSRRYGVRGDKTGFGRIEVVRSYPFPTFEGETLILESLVYDRIARNYRIRCVNEILKIVEYQHAGLSADSRFSFISNPRSSKLFFLEQLKLTELSPIHRLSAYANHTRFSLHAGLIRDSVVDAPSGLRWLLTLPAALLTYLLDRVRLRRR